MLSRHPETAPGNVVFLLDVDNTLIDNDQFAADLNAHLQQAFGTDHCDRYWSLYAGLRKQLGYADYLGALQAFRAGIEIGKAHELLQMSAFLLDYPFAQRLYPRALAAIAYLRTQGVTAVLSDGDAVFQPRKLQRSGIWDAVAGNVMIVLRKQDELDAVQRSYPAAHYVMVDDKPQILAAMKQQLGARLTTVFVRQGHYAMESADTAINPSPDFSINEIGDVIDLDLSLSTEDP